MHARRKKLVDEIRISRCIFFSSQFDENDVDGAKILLFGWQSRICLNSRLGERTVHITAIRTPNREVLRLSLLPMILPSFVQQRFI